MEAHSPGMQLKVQCETDSEVELLVSEVLQETDYKRQQDTLILWTESNGRDLALSFQEKAGCDEMWAKLRLFQHKALVESDVEEEEGEAAGSEGDEDTDDGAQLLPECTLANIKDIADTLTDAPFALKDKLSVAVVRYDYIPKLAELFRTCEELNAEDDLHVMYRVFKGLLALNESTVFDVLFRPDILDDFIGALEYDPALTGVWLRVIENDLCGPAGFS